MATKAQENKYLVFMGKHIGAVQQNLNSFIVDLISRGEKHDLSKLEEPELGLLAENFEGLAETEYGTDEYEVLRESVAPAIEHHYSKNRHHPEHWPNGIADMDLGDLIEMLADWKSSTELNQNGNLRKSIKINAEKYKITPQLRKILENSVDRYFS